MNFFELYTLPITFHPDQSLVKKQYYVLSKKFHPDFYINETPEKQQEVLELSTQNNKAYHVLRDPQRIVQYILEINGMLPEGENYALPQDFLKEMMEVNEAMMELEFDPDPAGAAKVNKDIAGYESDLSAELSKLTEGFETLDPAAQQQRLLSIKDLYYRNKYLLRLRESLNRHINQ